MAEFPTATAHSPNTPANYLSPAFPRVYSCDDAVDRLVVFNYANDFWHGKMCFGELLASRLGMMIGAPVPAVSPVDVPDEVVADLAGQPWDGSFDVAGVHVGFERVDVTALRPIEPLQSEVANLAAIASAIALAGWLDTRPGFTYFTTDSRMWFGRFRGAFGGDYGPRAWTADTLGSTPQWMPWSLLPMFCYRAPFDQGVGGYLTVPANLAALTAAAEAIANLSSEAIHDAVTTDVPEEWGIASEDLAAVETRLITMQPLLGDLLDRSLYRATHPYPPYGRYPPPRDTWPLT
jgi:hypothetical protein